MTEQNEELVSSLKAEPDALVVCLPTPWSDDASALLMETYAQNWFEPITINLAETGQPDVRLLGEVVFDDGSKAVLAVEPPIPELVELAGGSYEPYGASDRILLEQHASIWRLIMRGGDSGGLAAAQRVAQFMSAVVDAGAAGAFLPQAFRLHSPRTVRSLTVDVTSEQRMANLFVSAFHTENWMRTRGLTAFGFPELETPLLDGLNAAYFRLMDVAANMMRIGRVYPPGAQLDVGHQSFRLELGPQGPEKDPDVPLCGHFGVRAIMPKPV